MADLPTILAPFRAALHTDLDDESLASILLTYPACAVAFADGVFDDAERMFILEVCEQLADAGDDRSDPAVRLAVADRYAILMQLVQRREEFDASILGAIKDECQRDPATVDLVLGMLSGAAECSGGTSDVEQQEIDRIASAIRG